MARAEVEGKPAQWAVKVENHDPDQVAREHGFINLGQVGNLKNYFLFQAEEHQSKREAIEQAAKRLAEHPGVLWMEKQAERYHAPRN